MRFRNAFVLLGSLAVIILFMLSDPDSNFIGNLPFGAGTFVMLLQILKCILVVSFLFIVRKAMFDYDVADLEYLGQRAKTEPLAAAVYAVSIAIQTLAYAILIAVCYLKA